MTDEVKSGPLPGAAGGPNTPTGVPGSDGPLIDPGQGLGTDTQGSGVAPTGGRHEPVAPGIPSKANEGEDKGDLAPGPDRALKDIKNVSR